MRAENPSHALALVLTDELARCGITDAVLAPGSRSAALAMALHDDPRIRLHVEIDERSAAFLAIGLARASGRPAPVVVTSGSAVANLHPAVIEADTGHVPLLLLTADRPPELRHTGANQAIEQVGLFGRATRWSVDLGVAEDRPDSVALWRATASRAVAASLGLAGAPAAGSAPGPVQVNLGFREPTVPLADDGRAPVATWSEPLDGRPERRPWVSVSRPAAIPDDAALTALAGRMLATERGLVVVGSLPPPSADSIPPGRWPGQPGGVDRAGVPRAQPAGPAQALHDLARATGWPILAEATSGARTDPATALTHGHHLLSHPAFRRAHTPDLVLRVGRTGLSRAVASHLGPKVPQLLLDPVGAWHDPERSVGEVVVADAAATCAALAAQLGGPASSAWGDGWRAADRAVHTEITALLDADDAPSEPRTARDLAAGLPDGATLVVASSMPVRDLDLTMAPRRGLTFVANRGASGIDGVVSTALGVALAAGADPTLSGAPGEPSPGGRGPVVALAGDLSLLHDANGLLLSPAADHLDVVFVVVDNDGGGIFSFLPQAGFPGSFERVFGTPHGRDLAALARLHRLGYTAVEQADALLPAVTDAIAAGGIHLVHVRTDRAANVALHRRMTEASHAALDALA